MDVDITADIHGHTRYSDGRATPEEYVEYRRSIGMRLIAIADHHRHDLAIAQGRFGKRP